MNWSEYFTYDTETGILRWKSRPRGRRGWNTRFAGTEAGCRKLYSDHRKGRHAIQVSVMGRIYRAHRIIWEMMIGEIPHGLEIDHIDCDPWNNKLGNLRLCNRSENMMNRRTPKHNTSGYKGVSWQSYYKEWRVQIKTGGRTIHIGMYATKELAAEAYASAAEKYHGKFMNTEKPA
jgi:hypothetical protein